MESMSAYNNKAASWKRNFKHEIAIVLNSTQKTQDSYALLLGKVTKLFWSKFKDEETIVGFRDPTFFEDLAKYSLLCVNLRTRKSFKQIGELCFELGVRKNHDYGTENLSTFGTAGIIVRIGDKLRRLKNLTSTHPAVKEKAVDTLTDIFNYSVYGAMLSRGIWSN